MRFISGLLVVLTGIGCLPYKAEVPNNNKEKTTPTLLSLPKPSPEASEYSIALMRNDNKNGQWDFIINTKNGVIKNLKKSGNEDVDQINMEIGKFILKKDLKSHGPLPLVRFSSNDLSSKLINIMIYRRCTIYLFLQHSSRGTRIQAYGSNLIKHFGESFGTSLAGVNMNTIKKDIEERKIILPQGTKYFSDM